MDHSRPFPIWSVDQKRFTSFLKVGEDHLLISGGNEPYFDNGSYVVNPKRWEDAVDAPHEVCKPKDYNHISIWYISYISIIYINMVATECMNGAMIQFAMWMRISRSLPWTMAELHWDHHPEFVG